MPTNSSVLALDVGSRRVGIAIASLESKLPRPLTTIIQDETFLKKLKKIIDQEVVSAIVIGLPRNLDGNYTNQTAEVEAFTKQLSSEIDISIQFQDEAVTSKKAVSELESRGKPYKKSDIDS